MEERRGRRYKEGDQMVQRGGFLGIFPESSRENFQRRTESKKGWNREGRKLEEGVNSRGKIYTQREGSCYPVYRYVGSGARKPIGFLGPAGSTLVGRVDHPSWH